MGKDGELIKDNSFDANLSCIEHVDNKDSTPLNTSKNDAQDDLNECDAVNPNSDKSEVHPDNQPGDLVCDNASFRDKPLTLTFGEDNLNHMNLEGNDNRDNDLVTN